MYRLESKTHEGFLELLFKFDEGVNEKDLVDTWHKDPALLYMPAIKDENALVTHLNALYKNHPFDNDMRFYFQPALLKKLNDVANLQERLKDSYLEKLNHLFNSLQKNTADDKYRFAGRNLDIRCMEDPGLTFDQVKVVLGPLYNGPAAGSRKYFRVTADGGSEDFHSDQVFTAGSSKYCSLVLSRSGVPSIALKAVASELGLVVTDHGGQQLSPQKVGGRPCQSVYKAVYGLVSVEFTVEDLVLCEDASVSAAGSAAIPWPSSPGLHVVGRAVNRGSECRCMLDGTFEMEGDGVLAAIDGLEDAVDFRTGVAQISTGTAGTRPVTPPPPACLDIIYKGNKVFHYIPIPVAEAPVSSGVHAVVLQASFKKVEERAVKNRKGEIFAEVQDVSDKDGTKRDLLSASRAVMVYQSEYWTVVNKALYLEREALITAGDMLYIWVA